MPLSTPRIVRDTHPSPLLLTYRLPSFLTPPLHGLHAVYVPSFPFYIHKGAPWDCMLNWALEHGKEETKNLLQINFLGNTGIIVTDPACKPI